MRRKAKTKLLKMTNWKYQNQPRALEKRAVILRMEETRKLIQKTIIREDHRNHLRDLLPDHEAPKRRLKSQGVQSKEKSLDEKNHRRVLHPQCPAPVLVPPHLFSLDNGNGNDRRTKEDLDPHLCRQEVQLGHHGVDLLQVVEARVLVREAHLDLDHAS